MGKQIGRKKKVNANPTPAADLRDVGLPQSLTRPTRRHQVRHVRTHLARAWSKCVGTVLEPPN